MENMAGIIRLISTSTVKPASRQESIHSQRIELTPWDLQFLLVGNIQKGLLFLKPTHPPAHNYKEETENTLIHHLKTTFSRTLDFFSPGRLATEKHDDGTSSYFIVCDNTGAEFTHAVADGITVADVLEPVYVPNIVHSFFPLNGVRNFLGVSNPLLAVQVTELVDGIFIGCAINHVVGDGTSFWHFFNSWSEISRGNSLKNPPILHRWFLETITPPPIRFHLSEDEKLFERHTPPTLLKQRVFHFTKEKIATLKAKANAEIIGADDNNNRISSLQALLSHLWRSVTRCRRLDSDKEINFWMLIGGRTRVSPPLPSHYFGNSVHSDFIKMRAGELLELGLGHVASKMNEMVVSQTEERARNFLESWVKSPTFLTMRSVMGNHALTTSSSPRFNVYGNDFGWGKPVAVRSGGGNKADGKITIFPGREEGSVDIEACLLAETLEAMVNDHDFMDAVAPV